MYRTTQPLFLFCETPLHAGTGSDLGIIDLPIQRERHTGYPKIESSSLKGSLREAFERRPGISLEKVHRVFGFDSDSANGLTDAGQFFEDKKNREFSGCIAVTDARLLLFPVKSHKGVFAWITCHRVVGRFLQDLKEFCKIEDPMLSVLQENSASSKASIWLSDGKIGLEEYVFENITTDDSTISNFGGWIASNLFNDPENFWADKLTKDIVVLSDEDFADFVQHSTEVITRNKIDNETGTVSDTALFTEEFLPSESLLYSLALFAPEFSKKQGKMTENDAEKFFNENLPPVFQIGGDASLGKGIVRTKKTPTAKS
ncbi:MAG: type III-B CRISPR module RAMP protein Cmr4 [Saprospiraceae bacterium]